MKTVFFGNYYQSSADKKEPIEWLVLDEKDGKQLLVSRYALDSKPYNAEWEEVTWETCTLRKWLNTAFFNEAFSNEEKANIETTTVIADDNPNLDSNLGNITTDKVFILSMNEANEYFTSADDRKCKPTDYALAQGVYLDDNNDNCWLWLRSPGGFDEAAYVNCDGGVYFIGGSVDLHGNAVRPALWVKL